MNVLKISFLNLLIHSVRGYPDTDTENCLTLYSIENNNVTLSPELDLPKFPVFPSAVSVENDASLAKVACSVGHEIKRRVETYSMKDFLVKQGIDQSIILLKSILSKLLKYVVISLFYFIFKSVTL